MFNILADLQIADQDQIHSTRWRGGDGLYLLVHSDVLSGALVLVHSLALLVVLKIKLTFKAECRANQDW